MLFHVDVDDDAYRWKAYMTCGRLRTDLFTCWVMCLESHMTVLVNAAFAHK